VANRLDCRFYHFRRDASHRVLDLFTGGVSMNVAIGMTRGCLIGTLLWALLLWGVCR
jgi:hypothetical protein